MTPGPVRVKPGIIRVSGLRVFNPDHIQIKKKSNSLHKFTNPDSTQIKYKAINHFKFTDFKFQSNKP